MVFFSFSFQLFGEAVLGLSQGSVSELLSKPKPWEMLSIKGREPFIRMQLWLNDPQSVDRLQALRNEQREGVKRKRVGGGGGGGGAGSGSGFDSGSDRSSPADPGDLPYGGGADSPGGVGGGGGGGGASAAKKQRVLFSEEQKEALKVAFALDPYPGPSVLDFLAQDLSLEGRSVGNWFHNHRMRMKQQSPAEAREQQPGGTFDPVKYKLLCHQRMLEMQAEQQEEGGGRGGAGATIQHPSNSVTSFLRQLGLPTMGLPKSEGGGGGGRGAREPQQAKAGGAAVGQARLDGGQQEGGGGGGRGGQARRYHQRRLRHELSLCQKGGGGGS